MPIDPSRRRRRTALPLFLDSSGCWRRAATTGCHRWHPSTTVRRSTRPRWIPDVEAYCDHLAKTYVPIDIPATGTVAEVDAYLAAQAEAFAGAPAPDVEAAPDVQGEHGDFDANDAAAEALLADASALAAAGDADAALQALEYANLTVATPPAWLRWRVPSASPPAPMARRPHPSTCPSSPAGSSPRPSTRSG